MSETRPVFGSRPDGTFPSTQELLHSATRIVQDLQSKIELESANERSLVAAVALLTEAFANMYSELDAAKEAIRVIGGINVDELHDVILSGAVPEGLDAIGIRSGFGRPGGFRRFVLDRLDALEGQHGEDD
jgi:hypothetical protein